MSDDAAFLRGIQADPRDWSLRLVYADWLEERGDPRGELVRIEDEMRLLPVFGDRFWDLKPRRNELRGQVSPEWLEAMGFGTTWHPVFRHGWPDGLKERWRLIREIMERWRKHRTRWERSTMPDVGGKVAEVAEVESRLGLTLPPSVREWVAFDHDTSGWYGEFPLAIHGVGWMQKIPDRQALELHAAHVGYPSWAILLNDLALDDPPVVAFSGHPLELNEGEADSPTAIRLTTFVLSGVLATNRGEGGHFSTELADAAEAGWVRDALSSWAVAHCRLPQARAYGEVSEVDIFEAEDIRIEVGRNRERDSPRDVLSAYFAGPVPDGAIPPFLWDFARRADYVFGPFGRGKGLSNYWDPEQ